MPGLLALALEVAHDVAVVSIVSGAAFNAFVKVRSNSEDKLRIFRGRASHFGMT